MKNPVHYSWKTEIFPLGLLAAVVALAAIAYKSLPERVVTHWNFYGQPDGWNSRSFHVIFFPLLLAFMYAMLSLMPSIDPKRERYQEFARVYRSLRNMILLVLAVIFGTSTMANLGYPVNIATTTAGVVGLLMIVIGNYLGKLKQNFFIGLRTSWTLSSEHVWNKTHRFGSRIFVIWGALLAISPWLTPVAAMAVLIVGLLAIIFGITIYSYLVFSRERKEKASKN